jgi:RHS repeat-associated protein
VEYTYDAWGKPLTVTGSMAETLGKLNPLRYRGYVYDQETQLYYLQSRYYDPDTGRFLNADVYAATGQGFTGNNMFAYCGNNPINLSDPNGKFALGIALGKAALGAAVNVFTTYIGAKSTGQSYSWKDATIAAVSGALGTGNTLLKIAAGVVSGVYTGVTAYQNGANTGKAILSGFVSAWGTTVSVANIAGWTGPALNLGVSTFTDLVFGTAANSISAATYRASIDTSTPYVEVQQTYTQPANCFNRKKIYSERKLLL